MLGVFALACALAAGCGSSPAPHAPARSTAAEGSSARSLLAQVRRAAFSARTVRLRGSISGPRGPIQVDVGIVADKGGTGRVTAHGNPLQLTVVGSRAYVRAPAAAYAALAPSAAARLAGRWVLLSDRSAATEALRRVSSLAAVLDAALTEHGELYSAGETAVDGRRAIRLRDARGGSLYVAAVGTPYPLAIEPAHSDGTRLELTDWNQPVRLTAPRSSLDLEASAAASAGGQR